MYFFFTIKSISADICADNQIFCSGYVVAGIKSITADSPIVNIIDQDLVTFLWHAFAAVDFIPQFARGCLVTRTAGAALQTFAAGVCFHLFVVHVFIRIGIDVAVAAFRRFDYVTLRTQRISYISPVFTITGDHLELVTANTGRIISVAVAVRTRIAGRGRTVVKALFFGLGINAAVTQTFGEIGINRRLSVGKTGVNARRPEAMLLL